MAVDFFCWHLIPAGLHCVYGTDNFSNLHAISGHCGDYRHRRDFDLRNFANGEIGAARRILGRQGAAQQQIDAVQNYSAGDRGGVVYVNAGLARLADQAQTFIFRQNRCPRFGTYLNMDIRLRLIVSGFQ